MTNERALERRQAIIDHAHDIGITDGYISLLVDKFYERVREHEILGPIFLNAIGDNWSLHLARMKIFWSSVTMNSGLYSGKPVPAHQKHTDAIEEWHFDVWLGLFEDTLNDTAPSPEATAYILERAERIAKSLKLALFGLPSLRGKVDA